MTLNRTASKAEGDVLGTFPVTPASVLNKLLQDDAFFLQGTGKVGPTFVPWLVLASLQLHEG